MWSIRTYSVIWDQNGIIRIFYSYEEGTITLYNITLKRNIHNEFRKVFINSCVK